MFIKVPPVKSEGHSRSPSPSTSTKKYGSDVCTPDEKALWEKFNGLAPIPGLDGNLIAVYMTQNSTQGNLTTSSATPAEIEFGSEVRRYLLLNGVKVVRLICNGTVHGRRVQKPLSRSMLEYYSFNDLDGICKILGIQGSMQGTTKDDPEEVDLSCDVTVVALPLAYGLVQQLKMFQLVQESIKNSRIGVVIIADVAVTYDIIYHKWNEFMKHLKEGNLCTDNLKLICMNHLHGNSADICNATDLRKESPLGGCLKFCGQMECGHYCLYVCHPLDREHSSPKYRCKWPCDRVCPRGHKCTKACWEDCGKCCQVITVTNKCIHKNLPQQAFCYEEHLHRCKVPVRKTLPCGHSVVMACWINVNTYNCTNHLMLELPCGHVSRFSCSQQPTDFTCLVPVNKTLSCGHRIILTCSKWFETRGMLKCDKKCNQKLQCGHLCNMDCHDDPNYHKKTRCPNPCEKYCWRGLHRCSDKDHYCGEPCKPCMEPYRFKLFCSHDITFVCSNPDPDENTYKCEADCMRLRPFCGHLCRKSCFEDCGICEEPVRTVPPGCRRGHVVTRRCFENLSRCEVLTRAAEQTTCGHFVMVPCFQAENLSSEDLTPLCTSECVAQFNEENECGHQCSGTCQACYQGRFHVRCATPCDKILICGHNCPNKCNMICRPCSRQCENACEHKKCDYECGVPCVLECNEPCSYACEHSQCTRKCSEVCNKTLCFKPCPELQDCGHPCVGYCGETCPPVCGVCDPDVLNAGVFSEKADGEIKNRFIYLTACGHCIEAEDLEMWIRSIISSAEVLPLRCPICRTRMKWIQRFSSLFHENRQSIDIIREKIFGDQKEIDEILIDVETKVKTFMNANARPFGNSDYALAILDELKEPRKKAHEDVQKCAEFQSTDIQKARFMEWVCDEYINIAETMKKCYRLPPSTYQALEVHWDKYIMLLFDGSSDEGGRYWPLHPNEIQAARRERRRLDDSIMLYSTLMEPVPQRTKDLLKTSTVKKVFTAAENALWITNTYTGWTRSSFLEKLKDLNCALRYTLNLTEEERLQIVTAFGDRTGRWFKCANGHIYVITECGGATEIGTCNECGAPIGGENHQLLEQNYLSSEMDNADVPLYPTVLDREGANP